MKLAELSGDIESSAKRLRELNTQIKDAERSVAESHQRESLSQLETISHLDLTTKPDRIEAQIIIKRLIKEIIINTNMKQCDIEFHNGYKFFNYPLWREDFDGASWVNFFLLLGEKEYTFTGAEGVSTGITERVTDFVQGKPSGGQVDDRLFPEVEPDYTNTTGDE